MSRLILSRPAPAFHVAVPPLDRPDGDSDAFCLASDTRGGWLVAFPTRIVGPVSLDAALAEIRQI